MSTTVDPATLGFQYTNLNEVDPNFDLLPEGIYTFKIMKAELRDFLYKEGNKKGVPADTPGQFVKLTLAVTEHEELAGRRIFPVLFPSNWTMKVLRRLMDRVGVQQEPDEPLEGWLARLSEIQPDFKTKIGFRTDRDGQVILNEFGKPAENDVDWRTILPA